MTRLSHENSQSHAHHDKRRQTKKLMQSNLNAVEMAARYLRSPTLNAIRYALSNALAKLPFLPWQSRKAFLRSAAKRDRRWMHKHLRNIAKTSDTRRLSERAPQFGPFRGKDRSAVVGSDWHVALIHAVNAPLDDLGALPPISISFVTHNSSRWLPGLFDSLRAQAYPLSKLNLYFIDNASTDDTVAIIEQFRQQDGADFGTISIHRQDNVGFGLGHDVAFRASSDDLLLVSNVDLRFHADTIVRAVRAAGADQDDVASWELRQCPYEHPKYYDPVSLETLWSSYACILVRRAAYLDVGGFEERIFMYGEDVELSFRFRGAGYRLRYLPQVSVTHYVDFQDKTLRPHQLSGSVAANVLLRHRYGDNDRADEGLAMLHNALDNAKDPDRRKALQVALDQIARDSDHFKTQRRPATAAEFPFNGFDYDVARRGHDTSLDSAQPVDGPLVSIVTRTFGPNTSILREAIASVCNQTYDRIEHVIVEDRTDCAEDLVSSLRDAYGRDIRYVRSLGGGRSLAGNTGLEQSNGAFLMFLDNDDLLLADHVEILVRALLDAPEAPASYSLGWEVSTYYDQNGRYREDPPIHVPNHDGAFDIARLQKGNFLPIQNVLFRRSLFEQYGGFDPEIDHLEDWNLWIRYASSGDFRHVPKTTAMYRVPGDVVFRDSRREVMLKAEDAVRAKNAEVFAKGEA